MTDDPNMAEAVSMLEDLRGDLDHLGGWDHDFVEDMVIRWESGRLRFVTVNQLLQLRRIHAGRY